MAYRNPDPTEGSTPGAVGSADLIERVFQLRKSAKHAVVSQAGLTDLQRRMHVVDAVEDWLLRVVTDWQVAKPGPQLIVLSGNAGDGKSDLLMRLLDKMHGVEGLVCIADATQADEPNEDQHDRLRRFFEPFADDAAREPSGAPAPHLIAMNTGMVIAFFDQLATGAHRERFGMLEGILKSELGLVDADVGSDGPWPFVVLNLDRRDILAGSNSLFSQMMERLDPDNAAGVFGESGSACARCEAREFCFVRTNLELVTRPKVRVALHRTMREATLQGDVHLSPRNAWDFLSRAIGGDVDFFAELGGPSCASMLRLQAFPTSESLPLIEQRLLWQTLFEDPGGSAGSRGSLGDGLAIVDPVRRGGRHAHDIEGAIYAGPASERAAFAELAGQGREEDPLLRFMSDALGNPDVFERCRRGLIRGASRRAAVLAADSPLGLELRDSETQRFLELLDDYRYWGGENDEAPDSLLRFTAETLQDGIARIFGIPLDGDTYFRIDSFSPTTEYPGYVKVEMDAVEPVPDADVARGREWLSILRYTPTSIRVEVDGGKGDRGRTFRVDLPLFKLLRRVVDGYSASSLDLEAFYALRFACERLGGARADAREIVFQEAATGRFFGLQESLRLRRTTLVFSERS